MRAIARIGLACALCSAAGASMAAEPFNAAGWWVCTTGERTDYDQIPFRKVPITDRIEIDVRGNTVMIHGTGLHTGTYVVNQTETTPIQIFFRNMRFGRVGSLRNDGKLRVSMPVNATEYSWTYDMNCRKSAN